MAFCLFFTTSTKHQYQSHAFSISTSTCTRTCTPRPYWFSARTRHVSSFSALSASASSSSSSSSSSASSLTPANDDHDHVDHHEDDDTTNKKITSSRGGSSTTTTSSSSSSSSSSLSRAALWHQKRRKEMIANESYGKQILEWEQQSSQYVGIPLLILGNLSLLGMSIWAGRGGGGGAGLSIPAVVALAIFPGSILSLWQLQILHDCLHGTLLDKKKKKNKNNTFKNKQAWQQRILFWGSLPCVFGYYLYLQFGHLSHHKAVGSEEATLRQLFDSSRVEFEDGDVLFVSHRMNLKGPIGPQVPISSKIVPFFDFLFGNNKNHISEDNNSISMSDEQQQQQQQQQRGRSFPMSISRSGFHFWQSQQPIRNAMLFATSFLFERFMLCWNDVVVAVTGRNYFFPNKPDEAFHRQCATYTRCAVALRLALWVVAGWKSLLFLYLSETLWSIPPHPACAMFITNHGSKKEEDEAAVVGDGSSSCRPTASTYAGPWYSVLTLGTNYHCEHHDFPSIPFHLLGKLHQIAPEYYLYDNDNGKNDNEPANVWKIMNETFAEPDFYACSNANQLKEYS